LENGQVITGSTLEFKVAVLSAAAGTLIPPMLKGSEAISAMFTTTSGIVSVIGAE